MMKPLFCLALAATAAGCVVQPEPLAEPEAVPDVAAVAEPAAVEPVGPPLPEPAEPPAPGLCEQLLESLHATQPLLSNLDERLASQASRLEAAIDNLRPPAAEPGVPDCPETIDGTLAEKEVIGAIEWVYMNPPGRNYRARIDSASEISSVNASNIVTFERDGDDWVRFEFRHDDGDDPIEIVLPVKRTALIRQPGFAETERRIVVEFGIRLGERLETTEFTLTDRSRMTYPVLLGRTFLLDLYLVDVARSYTHRRYRSQ